MARVRISLPDELLAAARAAHLDISALTTAALAAELERRDKIVQMSRAIALIEEDLDPLTPEQRAQGKQWADGVLRAASRHNSAGSGTS
jgi:post-segregation antitoxin (ccd killing protein)